ncbi:MAG TPA: CARDB domain-containing protein, partial [Marmoricola sp.]|nr:CARDB domain-containing protein [Marmoricola sp.]
SSVQITLVAPLPPDPDPEDPAGGEATPDDLSFGAITPDPVGPILVGPGHPEYLTPHLRVTNPTGSTSVPFFINVSLSENDEFIDDEGGTMGTGAHVDPIAPGASVDVDFNPIEIEEARPANAGTVNWYLAGAAKYFDGNDDHQRSLSATPVTLTWDPNLLPPEDHDGTAPDLVVSSVSQSAPFEVYPNETATTDLSVTVTNQGNQASDETEVSYTWRPNQPIFVFYGALPALAPGESTTVDFQGVQWTDPFTTSPPQLVACADRGLEKAWGSVTESNEANNCSSTPVLLADGTLPPAPVDAPGDLTLPQAPAPIDLSATLTPGDDGSGGVTYWLNPGSGPASNEDVTIQAGSGVSARFQAPQNFVLDDELHYAVEPVSLGADDLPFDVLGAARILVPSMLPDPEVEEPRAESDLLTEKPITMTFTLSGDSAVPVANQVVFTADADGSNVRFVPIQSGATATEVTAQLDHFGIVGIASATAEQRQALADAWPDAPNDDPDRQIEHAIGYASQQQRITAAGLVAPRARAAAAQSTDQEWYETVQGLLLDSYNSTVVPGFAAADNNLDLAPSAIRAALSWMRQAQLAGVADQDPFTAMSTSLDGKIRYLLRRAAEDAASKCQTQRGLAEYRTLLSRIRQLALMGIPTEDLSDALPSCSRIEVEYVHKWELSEDAHDGVMPCTVTPNPCGDGSYIKSRAVQESGELRGTVEIDFYGPGSHIGHGPLNWQHFSQTSTVVTHEGFMQTKPASDCTRTTTGEPVDGSSFGAYPTDLTLSPTRNGPSAIRVNLRLFANAASVTSLPGPTVRISGSMSCDNGDTGPIDLTSTPVYVKPINDPQLKPLATGSLLYGTAVLTGFGSTYTRFWHRKTVTPYVKATGPYTPGGYFDGSNSEEEWNQLTVRPAPAP